MLRIRKGGLPPFVPLPVGEGAVWRLRAATHDEIEAAAAAIGPQLLDILRGSAEADALKAMLPGFDFGELPDLIGKPQAETQALLDNLGIKSRLDRLQEKLLLIEIATRCSDGWTGIVDDESGDALPLDRGAVALMLADHTIAERVRGVVYGPVHLEQAEKNGSGASPAGGAQVPTSAATVATPASPAPAV